MYLHRDDGWKGQFFSDRSEYGKHSGVPLVTYAGVVFPIALVTTTASTPHHWMSGSSTIVTQSIIEKELPATFQGVNGSTSVPPMILFAIHAHRRSFVSL